MAKLIKKLKYGTIGGYGREMRLGGAPARGVADQGTAGNGTRTETRQRPILTFNAWAANTSLWAGLFGLGWLLDVDRAIEPGAE
jgi:hypothetical protein